MLGPHKYYTSLCCTWHKSSYLVISFTQKWERDEIHWGLVLLTLPPGWRVAWTGGSGTSGSRYPPPGTAPCSCPACSWSPPGHLQQILVKFGFEIFMPSLVCKTIFCSRCSLDPLLFSVNLSPQSASTHDPTRFANTHSMHYCYH